MILVLDNYDSFTWNLVQLLGALGAGPEVRRNDELTVDQVLALAPRGIVISPGPGVPAAAGISVALIRAAAGRVPILGVCLGHQAIAEAWGAPIVRADRLMHGKTSPVRHTGRGVLEGLPDPFEAMRYHSLLVDADAVPPELDVTAWTDDREPRREIMGLAHRTLPVWGVQFHPESIGTALGERIVANFVNML